MKNNDSKILELKEQIKEKKAKLCKRPTYKTSMILNLSTTYCREDDINLNTLDTFSLISLLARLLQLKQSAEMFMDAVYFHIGSNSIEDWISDVKNKIVYKMQATRRKELEKMEEDLSSLLTNEKQTEIKVDSIADLLGKM